MTTETLPNTARPGRRVPEALRRHWPLAVGMLLLAIPTLIRLAEQTWARETGAHGPIVLATGLWLLFHNEAHRMIDRDRPNWWLVVAGLVPALAMYVFGRAYDFISLEALALYGVFLTVSYRLLGLRTMWALAFPFLYLVLIVPPPGWVIDRLTAPLQMFVSYSATELLSLLGYPIARYGVTITVAQYQLLVEDACAGMNSIVGLIAISVFYIYMLHRASWRYSVLLLALIIPIAILTNILRVIGLVLITYYLGDAAAQGFLHNTTGLLLFAVALCLMIGADAVLQRVLPASWRAA